MVDGMQNGDRTVAKAASTVGEVEHSNGKIAKYTKKVIDNIDSVVKLLKNGDYRTMVDVAAARDEVKDALSAYDDWRENNQELAFEKYWKQGAMAAKSRPERDKFRHILDLRHNVSKQPAIISQLSENIGHRYQYKEELFPALKRDLQDVVEEFNEELEKPRKRLAHVDTDCDLLFSSGYESALIDQGLFLADTGWNKEGVMLRDFVNANTIAATQPSFTATFSESLDSNSSRPVI